jgi:hypothetical protein
MESLPATRPPEQPQHCPTCDDCGWLPNPYGAAGDFVPCPICRCGEARWTTELCLPVELFGRRPRRVERDEATMPPCDDDYLDLDSEIDWNNLGL